MKRPLFQDQAKRVLSSVANECQRRAKRARVQLRRTVRDLEDFGEDVWPDRIFADNTPTTKETDFAVRNLGLVLSMPLHHFQDCLGYSLALNAMVEVDRGLLLEDMEPNEDLFGHQKTTELGDMNIIQCENCNETIPSQNHSLAGGGETSGASKAKAARGKKRKRKRKPRPRKTFRFARDLQPKWTRLQHALEDNVQLARVQDMKSERAELVRLHQYLGEKLGRAKQRFQVFQRKVRKGIVRIVDPAPQPTASPTIEPPVLLQSGGLNATDEGFCPCLVQNETISLNTTASALTQPEPPWMKPSSMMSSQRYLLLHWAERTTVVLFIMVLLHIFWMILRKPRHRKRLLRMLMEEEKLMSVSSPTNSLTNGGLVEMKMNGGDHCPTSPLLPETLSSVSTSSPGEDFRLVPPSHSAGPLVNGKHGRHGSNSIGLEELYRLKENECLLLEQRLIGLGEELKHLRLTQPTLDKIKQNELRVEKLQKLNSDLQELTEGKDVQLLNFSTQVQQLNKDLAARESQLSNVLNLYSGQKEELEKVKEESTRKHSLALQYNSAKLNDMDAELKQSKAQCESLTERLAEVTSELTEHRQKESMLRRQLETQSGRAKQLEKKSLEQVDAQNTLQGHLDEAAARCRELSDELRRQMKAQRNLQGEMDDQIRRGRQLEGQLQQRTLTESKIQEQLSTQVTRSRQLEEQLQQQTLDQRDLQQQVDNQIQKCQSLEEQLEKEVAARDDFEQQLARQSLELEKSHQLIARLTLALEKSQLEFARQSEELEKSQQELASLSIGAKDDDRPAESISVSMRTNDSEGELQRLQNEHMQLKSDLLDQTEKCDLLEKQVEQHKKLQAKQQDRNKILLETNQTLTEMIDQRQKRCGELEQTVDGLNLQLEKYQKRQGDEASKLEELRMLRREKQEIAQKLLTTQRRQSQEEQMTVAKMAIDLEEQQSLVTSLKSELESVRRESIGRLTELQQKHEQEKSEKDAEYRREQQDLRQIITVQGEQARGLLSREDSSASLGTNVSVDLQSHDPLLVAVPEECEVDEKNDEGPGLKDVLSSEVSMLLGLQGP